MPPLAFTCIVPPVVETATIPLSSMFKFDPLAAVAIAETVGTPNAELFPYHIANTVVEIADTPPPVDTVDKFPCHLHAA